MCFWKSKLFLKASDTDRVFHKYSTEHTATITRLLPNSVANGHCLLSVVLLNSFRQLLNGLEPGYQWPWSVGSSSSRRRRSSVHAEWTVPHCTKYWYQDRLCYAGTPNKHSAVPYRTVKYGKSSAANARRLRDMQVHTLLWPKPPSSTGDPSYVCRICFPHKDLSLHLQGHPPQFSKWNTGVFGPL